MKKKFLSIMLVLSMLCAFMPVVANAADDMPIQMTTATITKSETDTTYNFDVAAAEKYENCYVYAAIYAYDNTLLEVKRVPLSMTGNTSVSVSKSPYNALVKVFIWSDDMQPVIEAEEFTLTPTATMTPKPTAKPTPTPTPTPKPPSNITWSLNEATGTLTIGGTGDMEKRPWSYDKSEKIKSVTIGNAVTGICDYAFYDCSNLTDVYYNGTFVDFSKISISYGNTPLTNAKLHCSDMTLDNWGKCGDSTAYYLDEATGALTISGTGNVNGYWSDKKGSIKSVIIENGVTSIGDYAFDGCSSLTSVTIPDSVTSIGDYAFDGCSSLTSVTIPDSVTSIGNAAFDGCSSLTSVTIPEGVTSIGNYAFARCSGLTSVTIPDSVRSIGENVFIYCNNLDSVYITDLAAYLNINGTSPMCYAKKLYLNNKRVAGAITIPDGVTQIVNYAFSNCDGITSVTIPDSVTSIGYSAFGDCSSLKDVYITDLDAWYNMKFGNYNSNPMCYADNLYLNNELVTNIVIPEGITSIGNYVFSGCSGLTSITIPEGVTSIGSSAFDGCSSLTSVTIPDSVTSIGSSAFYNCYDLTSVTIPDGVTSIGGNAFYGCSGLKDIYITDLAAWCNIKFELAKNGYDYLCCFSNPMRYANNLYLNNEIVTDLVIPEGVTSISDCAFYRCGSLTSITIPDSVTSIGKSAFYGCSGLKSLTIGKGITNIDGNPFEGLYYSDYATGYDSLSEIIIPKSVTEIESGTFENFSALTTVKYCGSEAEWNEMYIGSTGNDYLKNANIVYNYVVE